MTTEQITSAPNWWQRFLIRQAIKKIERKIEKMKGSWKISAIGWLTLLGVIVYSMAIPLMDGNPLTHIDFAAILDALKNVGITLPVWLTPLLARQRDVSTEAQAEAGTKMK